MDTDTNDLTVGSIADDLAREGLGGTGTCWLGACDGCHSYFPASRHAVVVPQTSILQHDRYLVKVDPSPLRPHAGNHDMNLGQVHVMS